MSPEITKNEDGGVDAERGVGMNDGLPISVLGDDELIEAVRAGSTEAYGELWRRHYSVARSVAQRMVGSSDCEDVASEAFAATLAAIQNGRGPVDRFRSYLLTAVRNGAARTSSKTSREQPDGILEEFPDPRRTEDAILLEDDESRVIQALRGLPERWQKVLYHAEVEGLKVGQIAPLMQMTPNGVSALLKRASNGFRQNWVQTHVATSGSHGEHKWVLDHAGRYICNALSKRYRERIDAHLRACVACKESVYEAQQSAKIFSIVLLPVLAAVIGGTGIKALLAATRKASLPSVTAASRRKWPILSIAGTSALVATIIVAAPHSDMRPSPKVLADQPVDIPATSKPHTPVIRPTEHPHAPAVIPPTPQATSPSMTTKQDFAFESHPSQKQPFVPTTLGKVAAPSVRSTTPARPKESTLQPTTASTPADEGDTNTLSVTTVDSGGGALFPVFLGTSAPGATITISDGDAFVTTKASTSGQWVTPQLTDVPLGSSLATISTPNTLSVTAPVNIIGPSGTVELSDQAATVMLSAAPLATYAITWQHHVVGSIETDTDGSATSTFLLSPGGGALEVQAVADSRFGPIGSVDIDVRPASSSPDR